jgi:hypothetical protein
LKSASVTVVVVNGVLRGRVQGVIAAGAQRIARRRSGGRVIVVHGRCGRLVAQGVVEHGIVAGVRVTAVQAFLAVRGRLSVLPRLQQVLGDLVDGNLFPQGGQDRLDVVPGDYGVDYRTDGSVMVLKLGSLVAEPILCLTGALVVEAFRLPSLAPLAGLLPVALRGL